MTSPDATAAPAERKVFTTGTHRVRTPEETWDVIAPRLAEFGISRVADVTGLDIIGIPVAVAYRPLSRTLSVSQGKGHTLLLAKISAVMESVEMWHAEFACPTSIHSAVPAHGLDLPYRLADLAQHAGSLLTDNSPLDWVSARGLVSGRPVPLPRECVQLTSVAGEAWHPRGLLVSTNGLASGNSFAEAALHAVYEVIERDALSQLTSAPDDPRRAIRVETVSDPMCTPLIEQILGKGVFLDVAVVPNRWKVPCFAAFVWSEDFALLTAGSGAHSSPSVALSRALTEAVQSRLTIINGARDDLTATYSHVLRASTREPVADPRAMPYHDAVDNSCDTFDDIDTELRWICRSVAETTGHEPLAVDLSTNPDFAVVKVICPGLNNTTRHVIPRPDYAPSA
ncbi:YcaO-like family protein [Streptomyces sp. NPDC006335]|uniref:YcaO-like family protein n=1 Tax=Streptomyces sp. NPDC006335 TaxID=3156895 RepID=UPI0033A34A69